MCKFPRMKFWEQYKKVWNFFIAYNFDSYEVDSIEIKLYHELDNVIANKKYSLVNLEKNRLIKLLLFVIVSIVTAMKALPSIATAMKALLFEFYFNAFFYSLTVPYSFSGRAETLIATEWDLLFSFSLG